MMNVLKRLLAEATPGPWQAYADHPLHRRPFVGANGFAVGSVYVAVTARDSEGIGLADAALIAAAVNALPDLLAVVAAARAYLYHYAYPERGIDPLLDALSEALDKLDV